jgi:hypothetical protein
MELTLQEIMLIIGEKELRIAAQAKHIAGLEARLKELTADGLNAQMPTDLGESRHVSPKRVHPPNSCARRLYLPSAAI